MTARSLCVIFSGCCCGHGGLRLVFVDPQSESLAFIDEVAVVAGARALDITPLIAWRPNSPAGPVAFFALALVLAAISALPFCRAFITRIGLVFHVAIDHGLEIADSSLSRLGEYRLVGFRLPVSRRRPVVETLGKLVAVAPRRSDCWPTSRPPEEPCFPASIWQKSHQVEPLHPWPRIEQLARLNAMGRRRVRLASWVAFHARLNAPASRKWHSPGECRLRHPAAAVRLDAQFARFPSGASRAVTVRPQAVGAGHGDHDE